MKWRGRRIPYGGIALLVGSILIALAFSTVNFGAGLGHVNVGILSGTAGGNYAATIDRLSARATKRGGVIENVASQGSVDNARRLVEDKCKVHFALVQDGIPLPDPDAVEVIARLPRSETVFVIGRDAAKLTRFAELRGMKIGVGPTHSGTDYLARSLLESDEMKPLAIQLSNHDFAEQVTLVEAGTLDLAVFVIDENAALIRNAVRDRGLQLVSLEHLDVVPTRIPFLSVGTIKAGQYDALAVIPAHDHPVLRVDTLLLGNRCASRSVEIGVLDVFTEELPGFLAANREFRGGSLRRSAVAKEFFSSEGPGFADRYVPWLVDIMPLGNWLYIAMCVSVLFNLMTLGHKIRLWRVDANRGKAFQLVRDILGEKLTPAEIAVLEPTDAHKAADTRMKIDNALATLDALRSKTRVQEDSMLVPLGAEWTYRYEEEQIESLLTALRAFRAKLG